MREIKTERHGLRYHPLYQVWLDMIQRCTNQNSCRYSRYGARGISVCESWRKRFVNFYDWAIPLWEPGLQIERKDNDGNYCPENCKFATRQEQYYNRSTCRMITAFGETKCLKEWSEDNRCKTTLPGLRGRLKRGMSPEEAISLPPIKTGRKKQK
jgi:hypothetical protein